MTMKIETVPQAFRYFCDGCGGSHLQQNACGHYTESTPPGWTAARIVRMNDDGCVARDEKILICGKCVKQAKDTMFNHYLDRLLEAVFGLEPKKKEAQ